MKKYFEQKHLTLENLHRIKCNEQGGGQQPECPPPHHISFNPAQCIKGIPEVRKTEQIVDTESHVMIKLCPHQVNIGNRVSKKNYSQILVLAFFVTPCIPLRY